MKTNRTIISLAAATVLAAGATGAAYASGQSASPAAPTVGAPQPLSAAVASTVSVLKTSSDTVPADLVKEFQNAPDESGLAGVDLARAHAFPITGSSTIGYIAPVGDAVATFIPDPAGGYGASVATVSQIKQGKGTAILAGGSGLGDKSIIVQTVPDGTAGPTITTVGGKPIVLTVGQNVAAVQQTSGGTLEANGTKLQLPVPPAKFVTPGQ